VSVTLQAYFKWRVFLQFLGLGIWVPGGSIDGGGVCLSLISIIFRFADVQAERHLCNTAMDETPLLLR
jgi:hypothetical protein